MTFVYESIRINNILIEINQSKFSNALHVTASHCLDESRVYNPFTDCIYHDPKKARARFNLLKRKAARGEI